MNSELTTVTIPKDTLIHIAGIPFTTLTDIDVDGTQANLDLALRCREEQQTGKGLTSE